MWLIFISIQLLSTEINFQSECSGESLSLFQRHSQGMTQEWQSLRVFQRTDRMKGMGRGGGIWDRWEGNSSVGPVNHLLDRVPTYPNPLKSSTQPRKTQPNQRNQTPTLPTDKRGSVRGEGDVWSEDERRPNPTKGTRPHSQRTERDSERGEGVIWDSHGGLEWKIRLWWVWIPNLKIGGI